MGAPMTDDCPAFKGTGKIDLSSMTIKEYLEFRRDAGFRVLLSANRFLETSLEPAKEEGQGLVAEVPAIQWEHPRLHCGGGQHPQKRPKFAQSLTHFHNFKI
jgi:hypothetical protein